MTMAGNVTTLTPDNITYITYVYITFLTPSVIGSFSVLVVSLLRWRNLQEQRQLLVQLALADLLASAVLLLVTTSNLFSTKFNNDLCLYGLPLALVFYDLSFMLVIGYAFKSKNVFQGWRTRPAGQDVQSGKNREKILYALLWTFHIGFYLIYAAYITIELEWTTTSNVRTDTCKGCMLFLHVPKDNCSPYDSVTQAPIYFILFFMVAGVLLSCIVIYKKVFEWQQGQEQQQQAFFPVEGDGQSRRRFKHVKHTARKMVLVIFICWTPALLLFVLIWETQQSDLFPLYVIQAATVSLQGFLNSMVYAWKRPNFTEAVLGERTPLIAYDHVSFFEESLKTQSVC